jgi:hypothetical protein
MTKCKTCKDTGKISITFSEVNTPGVDPTPRPMEISCYRCTDKDGNFVEPKVFQEDLACFCKCPPGRGGNDRYVADGKCYFSGCPITHHHYHCAECGNVGQIG